MSKKQIDVDTIFDLQQDLFYYFKNNTNGERPLTEEEYENLLQKLISNDEVLMENGEDWIRSNFSVESLYRILGFFRKGF